MESNQKKNLYLPFKSVAGALLFCIFLGPVGLLYASVWGGVLFIVFSFLVLRFKLIPLFIFVWLLSCILGVIAANRYNNKLLR